MGEVTAVEFRLLGEVEARFGGRGVDIGHARQRCVLAVLLVEANRVVQVDQLLDRVWADRPPQRARTTLSSYLSRLRQVLDGGADLSLTRRAGGYVLTVDPLSVDLHRFRTLAAQARAADDDDTEVLDRALALWRGEAFATLDTPWLNAVREALDAERLAVELDRNDRAIRSGRHAELLGELSALATAYPLDERLAGQLILALYRSGRQADALHRYEQLRLRLADELGTDPSPPLRLLHKQILAADPALAAVGAGRPVRPAVPRQLPPPPRGFAGRVRELADLDVVLATAEGTPATVVISAVSGTAGVGKTALALRWAHEVADKFHDGQLYVNLRGFDHGGQWMDPADALRGFLDALDVPPQRVPSDLDAQAALYRSRIAGRRMLIVLDNARDPEQVRPLLPGTPGCLVLATSRHQLTGLIAGEGAHPVVLDLLTVAEAVDLLTGRLGAARVAAEPGAVHEIVAACARLPLALSIVASRAAAHPAFPLAALAGELRDARSSLDAFAGADPATDVRAVFSWSYHALSDEAGRLFRLLGLHPGPDLTAPAAASLTGLPRARVRPLLTELTEAHMLTEHRHGRYTQHDLLRAYAAEQAHVHDPESDRRAAVHRMLDHYVHTAYAAARLLDPHRDPINLAPARDGVSPETPADADRALAWLTTEHPVLLAAIEQASGTGFDTHFQQLAWTLTGFFYRQGHWRDWARTQSAALEAARRLADRAGEAYAHRGLARAYIRLGRFDDALVSNRDALDLYGELSDHAGLADTHLDLAWMLGRQGDVGGALTESQRALGFYQAANHRQGQASALNNIGFAHGLLGNYEPALDCCQQALALFQEIDDGRGEADAWDSLGYLNHKRGQHQQAITCYERALSGFRGHGHLDKQAETLDHLGDTHHALGDADSARDAWRRALVILDELDHPDADKVRAKLG